MFADYAAGNYRLLSNSPCIDLGNNAYVNNANDSDGNSRIMGYCVDMGAYEHPSASILPHYWLLENELNLDGSDDYSDNDVDGFNNWEEWRCDTVPTNDQSYLGMNHITRTGTPAGVVIWWSSSTNRTYSLTRSTNLVINPTFTSMASNIPGREGSTCYTDTTSFTTGPCYFQVGAE